MILIIHLNSRNKVFILTFPLWNIREVGKNDNIWTYLNQEVNVDTLG